MVGEEGFNSLFDGKYTGPLTVMLNFINRYGEEGFNSVFDGKYTGILTVILYLIYRYGG